MNIVTRQKGRQRAENVIDAYYDADKIERAMFQALQDSAFREVCRSCGNPYGQGYAGRNIANIVSKVSVNDKLLVKRMMLEGEALDGWYK